MSLLAAYVEAVRAGDAEAVAAVFTDDGWFHDEAPTVLGMDAISVRGRDALRETFGKMLVGGGIRFENVAFNRNAMRYDVVVGDLSIRCLGVYVERDGRIAEYHVTAVPPEGG